MLNSFSIALQLFGGILDYGSLCLSPSVSIQGAFNDAALRGWGAQGPIPVVDFRVVHLSSR